MTSFASRRGVALRVRHRSGGDVRSVRGEAAPQGVGAWLGATLWFAADEVAMPVLGLSEPTTRRPLEMHLQSLTAHLVYGAMTEVVRRLVRSQLGAVPRVA